jgi:hypothetical protein
MSIITGNRYERNYPATITDDLERRRLKALIPEVVSAMQRDWPRELAWA